MAETNPQDWKIATLQLLENGSGDGGSQEQALPIYQTTAFNTTDTAQQKRLAAFEEFAFRYSRVANPNADAFEKRVCALDGAAAGVSVCSGMAAVTYALLNAAEGGRILTTYSLYGGTIDSFLKVYPRHGIAVDLIENINDPDSLEAAIRPDTKAVFIESVSNPNAVVADIENIARVAHAHGVPLIVDNTIPTPYLEQPIRFGADVVVYSATKALSGHGTLIGGLILESGKFDWSAPKFNQFRQTFHTLADTQGRARSVLDVFPEAPFSARIRNLYVPFYGATLSPMHAYLALLGVETLAERLQKQTENAEKVVKLLERHPHVAWVSHPSASSSPYRALAEKYLPRGAGGILTFGVKGNDEEIDRFIDALQIFSFHANIGDARSLVTNPPHSTHRELEADAQRRAHLPRETIRLSIGLEDADDLAGDLAQALEKAFAPERASVPEREAHAPRCAQTV